MITPNNGGPGEDREARYAALRIELAAKDRELEEIKSSTAWLLVKVLWRIRVSLVPRDSRRESVIWTLLQVLRKRIRAPRSSVRQVQQSQMGLTSPAASAIAVVPPFAPPRPGRYDVVVFPIIDWEFRFQRPQQFAIHFARAGHRVFYLRTTLHRGSEPHCRVLADGVVEVHLPGPQTLNIYRDRLDTEAVDTLLDGLSWVRRQYGIVDAACLVDLPFWGPLALALQERYGWKVVYDCMDEHSGFANNHMAMLEQEERLTRSSDLVLATSRPLFKKQARLNSKCLLVPNAADYAHFAIPPAELADEVLSLPSPIIGYYGAIAEWFDSDLVSELARARPEWSFVLVGSPATADLKPLRGLANVHLLGEKSYAVLPSYLHGFDVCIIPFKRSPLTDATNPVKLFEYLSAGKPVIATELTELSHYADHVRLVANAPQWLVAIEEALHDHTTEHLEARMAFARSHTWEERFGRVRGGVSHLYPLASIIVVTYNNLDYNRLCLESIYARTTYPNYEVIIVDNASQDGTPEFLREFASTRPNCRVLLNGTNEGFARANNQGIDVAQGNYIVFLNNDTVVTPPWLSRLTHHLRDPQVGMVGPVTNSSGNESRIDVTYAAIGDMEKFARNYTEAHLNQTFPIEMLALFCCALRRSVVEEVGPLDDRFGIGMFEDDDYSLRVRRQGYRIVCAEDTFIHHWGRASFSRMETGAYRGLFETNRRQFEAKWGITWEPHRYRGAREFSSS